MRLLYTISIHLFGFLATIFSLFHKKSASWVKGRSDWKNKLKSGLNGKTDVFWVHCSSLGEFEQGRPIIEELKSKGENILVTFFSPSGYENLKNYECADLVMYLPLDTISNAKEFLKICKPKAVIFVKYEFWFNFMKVIHDTNIPLFLISGIFRNDQYFFKFYGKWFATQLKLYDQLFVQDEKSIELLAKIGIENCVKSGDNRFDRVVKIARNPLALEEIKAFVRSNNTIVAGSTWTADEAILHKLIAKNDLDVQIILAPHHIDQSRKKELLAKFGEEACLYSELKKGSIKHDEMLKKKVLIIDVIGILSSIYQFSKVSYIGGGFGQGIHNSLEAAVYGSPLIFGPNYKRFKEAVDMVDLGSARSVSNSEEAVMEFQDLFEEDINERLSALNKKYVEENAGASDIVLNKLKDLSLI